MGKKAGVNSPWGHQKNSRAERGCFTLTIQATHPEPLEEIRLEGFLAMLRLEQRNKFAELGYQEILGMRCTQLELI